MQELLIDELDTQVINALQISPRAPWTSLAELLGVDGTTLARRWSTLLDSGLVWTSCYRLDLSTLRGAVVEISAEPGQLDPVISELCALPAVMTVDVVASGASLIATIMAESQELMQNLLLDVLPCLPHVSRIRSHLLTGYLRTADQWELRSLEAHVASRIPRPLPPRAKAPKKITGQLESVIMSCLGRDVRTPASVMARMAGVSAQQANDALAVILNRPDFKIRTDIASHASSWPVHVWYFLDVPVGQLDDFLRIVANLPEVRFAATSAGSGNVLLDVWLRNLGAIHQLEAALQRSTRGILNVRRDVVLRTAKRIGHLLDHRGRNTGKFIPPRFA